VKSNLETDEELVIAYLDESYGASSWYYVGACVGTVAQIQKLSSLVSKLSMQLISLEVDPWREFHGYELFHGEGEWLHLKGKQRLRVKIYGLFLDALLLSGCTIWLSGVETFGLSRKYGANAFHPHEVALHNLLDSIDSRLQPQTARVQVIADNLPEKNLREARMKAFKDNGTMGTGNKSLSRIEMPFRWEESISHIGLQAVDMALYLFQRHHGRIDKDPRAGKAVEDLVAILRPAIKRERLWKP